jgi:uncharacterized Fe-S cluster-containing radical SAM superfamily protein
MKYYEVDPVDSTFTSIFVDLTHRCNMSCANCYLPNREFPDADLDRLYAFFSSFTRRVGFRLIGGEPTLYPHLDKVISFIKSQGHHVTLITNGLKLSNIEYVQKLKSSGLTRVQISMNGADCNELYQKMDSGNFAELKIKALENLINESFLVTIGQIWAKGINELALPRNLVLVERLLKSKGLPKTKSFLIPSFRIRNIGKIGRYQENLISFDEMLTSIGEVLDLPTLDSAPSQCGSDVFRKSEFCSSKAVHFTVPRSIGPINIKVTDWSVDEDGVIDPQSSTRGRMTKNFKVAPFFEDIKLNEFGY